MLLHGSIVGIFAITKAHEMVYHHYYSNEEYYEHTNIIYGTECLRIFHLFILLLFILFIVSDFIVCLQHTLYYNRCRQRLYERSLPAIRH